MNKEKQFGKKLIKIFETQAYYYGVMTNGDNIANAGYACLINECLKLEEFNKQLTEEDVQLTAMMVFKADEMISIMMNLSEEWQNIMTTTNPDKTMLSPWFSILATSAYLYYMTLWFHKGKSAESHKYSTLFEARDLFFETAKKVLGNPSQADSIFQNIEGCLGYNGPIKLKPLPESPGSIFNLALFLQNNKTEVFRNKMISLKNGSTEY